LRIVAGNAVGKNLYDETKINSHKFGKNQRTGWQTIRRASRWLKQTRVRGGKYHLTSPP
jgi:hypothetical protein